MSERHILDLHGVLHTPAEHALYEHFFQAERDIHRLLNSSNLEKFSELKISITDTVACLIDVFVKTNSIDSKLEFLHRMRRLIEEIEMFLKMSEGDKKERAIEYKEGILASTEFLLRHTA